MRIAPYLAIVSALAVAFGAPLTVRAASKPANRTTMEKAAKKACITGDFQKGIDLLGDLYVETNDATYIYNQGRCFEQNHRWQDAIDRFREHLRKVRTLPDTEKAEVYTHIADCEAEQAKANPPPAQPIVPVEFPAPTATAATRPALAPVRRATLLPRSGPAQR